MRVLQDFQGLAIRLTDERLAHILEHPEMVGMEPAMEERCFGRSESSRPSAIPRRACTIGFTSARE